MMKDVLSGYLNICRRFQTNAFLSKVQRKERHCVLMEWVKHDYKSLPSIDEIIEFINTYEPLPYEQPFFSKVVFPCTQKDISLGSIQAIRFLFEYTNKDTSNIGTTLDCVVMFCKETEYQFNVMELSDMILFREPNNKAVIYYKYFFLKRYLEFTIHEVPWCVLCGMNGAEKQDIPYMKKYLSTFASISKKLNIDDKSLIDDCDKLYEAWEVYIEDTDKYSGFEDYLIQHGISYC